LAQQQSICDTLARTAQDISQQTQTQTTQTLAEIHRLMSSNEALVQARIAAEAQWSTQHSQRAEEFSALLREELAGDQDHLQQLQQKDRW
jgi:transposase